MTKNKFAHPPYLPEYDSLMAVKLLHILRILSKTCCEYRSVQGVMVDLDLLISRPSTIRKVDLPALKRVMEAIEKLEHLFWR